MFNFKKIALGLGIFTLGLTSTTIGSNFVNDTQVEASSQSTYIVKKGDTLWNIANKHNLTVSKLKSINNLTSNIIHTGQKLSLYESSTSTVNKAKTYTVKKGDTLWGISNKNNLSVNQLKNLNNLSSNVIHVGQVLKLTSGTISSNTNSNNSQPTNNNTTKVITGYTKTYTSYGTKIHVYVSDSNDQLNISYGVKGKLEPLSKISVPNEKAKANLGFFASTYEHSGLFYKDKTIYSGTAQRHVVAVFNNNNKLLIKDFGTTIDANEKTWLHNNAKVAFGTSYSLVNTGKVNLYNSSQYSHANSRNPRTMLGQLPDGRLVLAVTDGRGTGSSGLTASQSANFMKDLGVSNAVNLDGGGSSTLIHSGKIQNKLQNNTQRYIGTAVFITH